MLIDNASHINCNCFFFKGKTRTLNFFSSSFICLVVEIAYLKVYIC